MKLMEMSLEKFLSELGSASPAPGGGSVAALAGALAAALCRMVSALTAGKEKYRDSWADMERVGRESAVLEGRLRVLVDEDTQAFRAVMETRRLPKGTDRERQVREQALDNASLTSANVPLSTLEALRELSALALCAADRGNPRCVTDAGSASQMIRAGALSAAYNVRVNLPSVRNPVAREELQARTAKVLQEVIDETQRTENIVEARLELLQA
ncbi:MAG: cyclodeaminase/cyclohydrolase family protein [Spirochaetia bacterium]